MSVLPSSLAFFINNRVFCIRAPSSGCVVATGKADRGAIYGPADKPLHDGHRAGRGPRGDNSSTADDTRVYCEVLQERAGKIQVSSQLTMECYKDMSGSFVWLGWVLI